MKTWLKVTLICTSVLGVGGATYLYIRNRKIRKQLNSVTATKEAMDQIIADVAAENPDALIPQ